MTVSAKRAPLLLIGIVLLGSIIASAFTPHRAFATQITTRSLTLESAGTTGGSTPGGTVNHLFKFTAPSTSTLGSIQFQYCTTADGTCTAPTGLDTSSATLGTSTGNVFTSAVSTAANIIYITRTAANGTGGASQEELLGVKNPSGTNETFFARITTYAATNATGAITDSGNVAASTADPVVLNGIMPESLIFCTGQTVGETASVPDCSTATSAANIQFTKEFSPTYTSYATSQMAASTNANHGYAITVTGPTMTSGGNTIPAIGSTATTSTTSTGQFGLNLVHDTATDTESPALNPLSADVTPSTNAVNYLMGAPASTTAGYTTDFSTDGSYAFVANSPNVVANSDAGTGTSGPTDSQIFTVTYIVNVAGHQPAGNYSSTLTYICTASF